MMRETRLALYDPLILLTRSYTSALVIKFPALYEYIAVTFTSSFLVTFSLFFSYVYLGSFKLLCGFYAAISVALLDRFSANICHAVVRRIGKDELISYLLFDQLFVF